MSMRICKLVIKKTLHSGSTDIPVYLILCWGSGGCSVYCRIFNSIPGFYSVDARIILYSVVIIVCVCVHDRYVCVSQHMCDGQTKASTGIWLFPPSMCFEG